MLKIEPEWVENWLWMMAFGIFILSVIIMANSNAQATLFFIEAEYGLNGPLQPYLTEQNARILEQYRGDVEWKEEWTRKMGAILYTYGMSLISLFYVYKGITNFKYKKVLNNMGVKENEDEQ